MCGVYKIPHRCGHVLDGVGHCHDWRRRETHLWYRHNNPECEGFRDNIQWKDYADYCCCKNCCSAEFETYYDDLERFQDSDAYADRQQRQEWERKLDALEAKHKRCQEEFEDLYYE